MAAKRATPPRPETDEPAKPAAAYVVFARRFRPQSFAEVAGQTAITSALKQALASGRLAQAYLFCGPRGVGKTSLARILAKALNCKNGRGPSGLAEDPCNECEACQSIQDGRALDVIEMDAATNRGIEEVRSLRENVGISPAELRFKVYIIDEVHMLTREAWNAFLKTLEEPPAHVKFVFATTDPNNVPETILSRCQRFDLRRIGPADIVKRLQQICELENVPFEPGALSRIASLSRGGLRDAEGLLDQAVNLSGGKVTDAGVRDLAGAAPDELIFDILKLCSEGKAADVLLKAHQALEAGADPDDMLGLMTERLRGSMLAKVCGADSPLLEGQEHLKEGLGQLGQVLSEDQCLSLIQLFTAARRQMRDAAQTRLPLEMALIRASRVGELVDLGKLVGAIESGATTGAVKPSPASGPTAPNREGPRPNSAGRPAEAVSAPAAAIREPAVRPQSTVAAPTPPVLNGAPDPWQKVLAALNAQKTTVGIFKSALTFAAARLDVNAGRLSLGFQPNQVAYRKAITQPQNHAALSSVLQQIFGRSFEIDPPAESNGVAPAAPPRPATITAIPGPQQSDVDFDDLVSDESSEESVDFDSLESAPPKTRTALAPATAPEGRARPLMQAAHAPAPMLSSGGLDTKAAESHPLVQMVLKETQGLVIGISQSAKKVMAAGTKNDGKD